MMPFTRPIFPVRGCPREVVVTVLVLCAFLAGCDFFGGSDSVRGEIEHDIVFDIREQHVAPHRPVDPRLVFTMRTEDIFPCVNYSIRYDVDRSRDQVRIRVLDILEPRVCLTAFGPATATFELPLASGTYELALLNGAVADLYEVTVTDARIHVETKSTTWSRPKSTVNWRFPPNSFGYYCGTLVETSDVCEDFASRLQDLPLSPLAVPDAGTWPYPLSSSGHYYDAPAQFYLYPDAATWEEVKERLRAFTRERLVVLSGTNLFVQNWRGDAARSWMIDDR